MKLSLSLLLPGKRNLSKQKFSSTHARASNNEKEVTDSSYSYITCGICFDLKTDSDMFKTRNSNSLVFKRSSNCCNYLFCLDCICKYVTFQVNNNLVNYVTCPSPNCFVELKQKHLQHILPKQVIVQWESLICESSRSILFKLKTYCWKLYQDFKLDKQFLKLAKREKWQRCPQCYFYVTKSDGCNYIRCRCGCDICYIKCKRNYFLFH
jgi:E3 ubiquitin-protein ligase RNF144